MSNSPHRQPLYYLLLLVLTTILGCSPAPKNVATTLSPLATSVASARGVMAIRGGRLELSARSSGTVRKILVQQGTYVQSGRLLAILDNPDLHFATEQARLELAQTTEHLQYLQLLQPGLSRLNQLEKMAAKQGVATEAEAIHATQDWLDLEGKIAEARQTQRLAQLHLQQSARHESHLLIKAPINGLIDRIPVQKGQWLNAADYPHVFTLIPDQPLIIRAEVNETFINRIHTGQRASVQVESLDNSRIFLAHVAYIGAQVEKPRLADLPQMANDFECQLTLDVPQYADQAINPHPNQPSFLHLGQTVLVKFL